MSVAPIVVNFMLTCHFSCEPGRVLGYDHWHSTAGTETRAWLRENDLIDDNNRSTPRGAKWVEFICETPLPVSQWVKPQQDSKAFWDHANGGGVNI